MANETGYNGQQDPGAGADDLAATGAIVRGILAQIQTTKLVQVRAVRNTGGLAAVGFIDVQPMVNQTDGAGNQTPHGIIYNVPYLRMQGGTDAIIMDPKVGDIGYAGFCTHDISTVKTTRAISNPGSRRRFDYADAVYIGGLLNGVPEQYIQFSTTGIKIHSPTNITLDSPGEIDLVAPVIKINATTSTTITTPTFTVNGVTQLNGAVHASGTIDAGTSVTAPAIIGTSTVSAPTVTGSTDVVYGGKSAVAHRHTGGTIAGNTGTTI